MNRDLTLFPEDETGDMLWKMLTEGDDLAKEREIEFSVIFANQDDALKFGHLLLQNNQKLSFCPYQENQEYPWEITAYPEMAATYENVMTYINLLKQSAEPLSGIFDGWYCVTASKLPY